MPLAPETKVTEMGGYNFHHHYDNVIIEKDDTDIEFSAAEAEKVIQMFHSIGRMVNLKRIPPFMNDRPFAIGFSKDGVCHMTRNNENSGLKFPMTDVDFLIEGTQATVKKLIDLKTLSPNPNNHLLPATPDIPWTGR